MAANPREPVDQDVPPASSRRLPRFWRGRAANASRRQSGDVVLVAGGIALGLTCAFFPWYVFFNQEQFGIRAVKFHGNAATGTPTAGATPARQFEAAPETAEAAAPTLDTVTTGTLPRLDETTTPAGLADQPFPALRLDFALVHIANGRAMIEDDKGLWVVQPGSILPDNTRVTGIEQRDGQWVMLTSAGRVLAVTQ